MSKETYYYIDNWKIPGKSLFLKLVLCPFFKVSESVVVMDSLEFVDHASNIFLAELSSTISAFNAVFTDYPEGRISLN